MIKKSRQAIGIFDSGIGGLTVANAINKHLPNEELIYFGDSAHLPYGDKSADAIRYYSLKIVKFLLEKQCKMIVIACNSASTTAYPVLMEFFKGQALFVEVVEPMIKAVAARNYSKVGVIATKATIRSGIYEKKLKEAQAGLTVASLATPLLVPMIEEGYVRNNISEVVLNNYLSDKILEGIEALLLSCTHYPLIRPNIDLFFKGKVSIFDSTDVVASEVKAILTRHGLCNDKRRQPPRFYVSDYTSEFEEATRIFYHEPIHLEHCPIW